MPFKMNHLHLKTNDPDKTARFYVDVLGATIVRPIGNGGFRLDLHGLQLNLTKLSPTQKREQKLGIEHIAMDTDELDALASKLAALGINVLEQVPGSSGQRVCFFEGPDGVQLEFIESKP